MPNKNIKMSSFKSSENIQKKEGGPDRSVSDNQSSSVTLNELAMKARTNICLSLAPGMLARNNVEIITDLAPYDLKCVE